MRRGDALKSIFEQWLCARKNTNSSNENGRPLYTRTWTIADSLVRGGDGAPPKKPATNRKREKRAVRLRSAATCVDVGVAAGCFR